MPENVGDKKEHVVADESQPDFAAPDVNQVNVVWTAVLVEGLFLVLAVGLSYMGFYDHEQPLEKMVEGWLVEGRGIYWTLAGIAAAGPLIAGHWLIDRLQPVFYQSMQQLVERFFYPMFSQSTWVELLVVSLAAGFGEELLFRWCLQGGMQNQWAGWVGDGPAAGLAILIAGAFFGACHFVNRTYFAMAAVAGIYLGLVMWLVESWVAAAIAHAAFDFYALMKIKTMKFERE